MEVIINREDWKSFIVMPLSEDREVIDYLFNNIAKEMKSLGYANKHNDIVLNKNYTIMGFWNNYKYSFKKSFLDYIFKKTEEMTWDI